MQEIKKTEKLIDPAGGARPWLWQSALLLAVLATAALIRFYQLADASLWLDEAMTLRISANPLSVLWTSAHDTSPPLFYTIENLVLRFGSSEFLIRLPSAVFSTLTVYTMYRAARAAGGYMAGLCTAVFLTFSCSNIEYGQEARTYALLGFGISLALLGLIRMSSFADRFKGNFSTREFFAGGAALYAVSTLAMLYSHDTGVFFVLAAQVYAVWLWQFRLSRNRRFAVVWFAMNAVILLLWLPWLFATLQSVSKGHFSWLPQATVAEALHTVWQVHGYRGIELAQPYLALPVALLMLVLAGMGLHALRRKPELLVLCLAALASSTVLTWWFGYIKPIFLLRTILWGSLFTAFLFGMSVSGLKKGMALLVISALALLGMKDTLWYFKWDVAENQNWRAAVDYIAGEARAGDDYVVCANYSAEPFAYYAGKLPKTHSLLAWDYGNNWFMAATLRKAKHGSRLVWESSPLGQVPAASTSDTQLWFVDSHCNIGDAHRSENVSSMIARAGWQVHETRKFKDIDIHVFVPPP